MNTKQRQHWQHQLDKAERLAKIYGAGDRAVREIRIKAEERLMQNCRRTMP